MEKDAALHEYAGLSEQEVTQRTAEGKLNTPVHCESLSLKDIVRENVCTYFNLIFLLIAVCLIFVGSYRDLTFLPIIIANTLIGIVQEWRSKKLLDRLTIMTAPQTRVMRDGKDIKIASSELVEDDLVILESGNQVPADARILDGEVAVNEALLTGEAEELVKHRDEMLLSGSFIVSGTCRARLEKVGAESYISKLTLEAKERVNKEQSEMIRSLDRLVLVIGILIIPITVILFSQQYFIHHTSLKDAVTGTVAAILGMIPEGLYLLASVAMAVSAMRLAMARVLVHNMKSIETLARVDVLCVDKTGTITENTMTVKKIVPLSEGIGRDARNSASRLLPEDAAGRDAVPSGMTVPDNLTDAYDSGEEIVDDFMSDEIAALELKIGDFAAAMSNDNPTIKAIKTHFSRQTGRRPEKIYPFSPIYKYSAAVFQDTNYVLGAPEFVLKSDYPIYAGRIEQFTLLGYRTLVFGLSQTDPGGNELTQPIVPLCLILLTNPVREKAAETFAYFDRQGVRIKVISGDNPMTVSEVAMEAGIPGADRYIDASALEEEDMQQAAEQYTVFGRVTPAQKRSLIAALKKNGHTVAMTGDGVNDVLALKDADCSIAMASGSDAAAHVAQMVLLESDFSRMPAVVSEGRRVVNNIQRTASLFLVKNIFSLLMSLFSIIFMMQYPLQPSQISLVSMFTIGAPAFILSLESNTDLIKGRFMSNVLFKALPAGLTDFVLISFLMIFCGTFTIPDQELSTLGTVLLAIIGVMILYKVASPMTPLHWFIWGAVVAGLLFAMFFLGSLFAITPLSGRSSLILIMFVLLTEPVLRYISYLIHRIWQLFEWIITTIRRKKEEQEKLFADMK